MKRSYLALILLIFISWTGKAQPTLSEFEASIKAGIDPYFVKSKDTVSAYGPNCVVRNALQDKKGNIWLATWQGIMCYDGKTFTNYTLKNNLIKFHVFSLFEDSKGNIWFGTARGGLYKYDGKSFTLFTTKNGLADNTVLSFAEDKKGNIWLGTENGLSCYNDKTFTNFTTKNGLSDNYINAVITDRSGKLWLGTKEGVNWFDGKTFAGLENKDGSQLKGIASLFEDKTGTVWIGSEKGLCSYNGKSVSDVIVPNFVMYMCEDKKGNLLFAHNTYPVSTKMVLYKYDGKAISKIMEEPLSGSIFGIIEDKSGNVWFGTGLGVCCFDVVKGDNTCVKKTCKHEGSYQQVKKEHEQVLAKSYTYFKQ